MQVATMRVCIGQKTKTFDLINISSSEHSTVYCTTLHCTTIPHRESMVLGAEVTSGTFISEGHPSPCVFQ